MDEPPLYCPHCDYNLTGLTENRCPECGRRYNSRDLLYSLEDQQQRIQGRGFVFKILAAPAVVALLVGISALLPSVIQAYSLASAMLVWILGCGAMSLRIASQLQRVRRTLVDSDPRRISLLSRFPIAVTVLFVMQTFGAIFILFAGIVLVAFLMLLWELCRRW